MNVLSVKADKYKVLYDNSSKITIENKPVMKGLVFDDSSHIKWTSNDQAIKVVNLTTNRVSVIPAIACKKNRAESIYDLLIKVRHMSSRGYDSLPIAIDTIYYLLDTLMLEMGRCQDERVINKALLVLNGDTCITEVQTTKNNKQVIITRKIFGGKNPSVAYLDILAHDPQKDWTYYVYKRLRIEPLPLKKE